MSPKSLKTYGIAAADLIWRWRLAVILVGLAAGLGVSIALAGRFDLLAAVMLGGFIASAGAALVAAALVALKLRSLTAELLATRAALYETRAATYENGARLQILNSRAAFFDRIETQQTSQEARIRDLTYELELRTNTAARDLAIVSRTTNAAARDLSGLVSRVASAEAVGERLVERVRDAAAGLRAVESDLAKNTAETIGQFKKVDAKLAEKTPAAKFEPIVADIASLNAGLTGLERRQKGYHVHERNLTPETIATLKREWAETLGVSQSESTLGYMAARIGAIETLCAGRLATASSTMIARLLAGLSIDGASVRILEIGVLFGVASACFNRVMADYGRDVRLTLIDPFEGYYDRGAGDIITGVPVTRAAFERNMAAAGVAADAYEIIQGMSDDPAIIKAASASEYDLLLIDGDHSFDGVRKDFENFGPMVREGGVILFDDYGVNEWPDIKNFVDGTPLKNPSLTLLASGFRTAAFRVDRRLQRS